MKWTGRTSIETIAMRMAEAAGIPARKFLSSGEYQSHRKLSIWMTKLPGTPLANTFDILDIVAEEPWLHELMTYLDSLCQWRAPISTSVLRRSVPVCKSQQVPCHIMDPFYKKDDFYMYLFSPVSPYHGIDSVTEYKLALSYA
ncbi:uncharacterized protein BDW43DRAFT_285779 [Aspergillus alliaceus]|uniref:uncharacterized protein n=1 Tax=Petromyces alliaceus TaxID=209559 RepID=UPI0012A3D1BB|nr:uncharacterized protein BDW43DRAFT_285779 [Aspergillus alliaceus]KAB8230349.1 hypothetical protein BDW43DRAFT_285779 [Aspergillus alliaceus]